MRSDEIAYEYYSHWTGLKMNPQMKGLFFHHHPERDNVLKGYSQSKDIYVFAANDLMVISYGNKAKPTIEIISVLYVNR
jgi:hypothetical protein